MRVGVADVSGDRHGVATELAGGGLRDVGVGSAPVDAATDVEQGHGIARGEQALCDGPSDAASGTRDQMHTVRHAPDRSKW